MFCNKCNHKLPDDSEFCQYCGNKIEIAGPEEEQNEYFKILAEETVKNLNENSKNQPNNEGDIEFGLVPEKPIYTLALMSVDGEREYLNQLYTENGVKIKWNRRGSTSVNGVNGMIDVYDTYLPSGEHYKTIYINMYGATKSEKAPVGFTLNNVEAQRKKKKPKEDKKVKIKFCSRCGSIVNDETKICSGCGKKYFKGIKFTKFSVTMIMLIISIIINFALYIEVDKLNGSLPYLRKKADKFEFYKNYVAIVPDDGSKKYHVYGCEDLDLYSYSFWIYSKNQARKYGYHECYKCR